MTIKIDTTKKPFENCPYFYNCAFNKCPIHPDFEKLKSYSCDLNLDGYKSKKCRLTKCKRIAIAKAFNLKNLGLRPKEKNALLRWQSLSEAEKQEQRDRMKNVRKLSFNPMKTSPPTKIPPTAPYLQKPYKTATKTPHSTRKEEDLEK